MKRLARARERKTTLQGVAEAVPDVQSGPSRGFQGRATQRGVALAQNLPHLGGAPGFRAYATLAALSEITLVLVMRCR